MTKLIVIFPESQRTCEEVCHPQTVSQYAHQEKIIVSLLTQDLADNLQSQIQDLPGGLFSYCFI